eukprot:682224_1
MKKIMNLKKNIIKKTRKITQKRMKNNKDPFKNTQIVNNYNRFKKSLNNDLNEYMEHQSKHRRPHNIDHDTIHRVTTKLQERDETGDKKLILQADKNYGNVIIFESDWDHINDNYVRAGQSNIKPLNCDRTATIENAIRMQVNIVYKYKKLYTNYGKVIGVLNSKRIRTIGKWRASPKVHKRKNGIPIKKIRPLINLKNTIITVASNTIKDITRKVAMAMRSFHNNQTECEDVKDIIIQIIQHNNNDPLNNYASDQQLLVADIGSMYDNITMIDVKKTMNMALKMMPPGLISNEMYNLWFESMDFLEEHLIFDYKEVMYRIYGSQTQGTSSGGDNSTFTTIYSGSRVRTQISNKQTRSSKRFITKWISNLIYKSQQTAPSSVISVFILTTKENFERNTEIKERLNDTSSSHPT